MDKPYTCICIHVKAKLSQLVDKVVVMGLWQHSSKQLSWWISPPWHDVLIVPRFDRFTFRIFAGENAPKSHVQQCC